MKRLTKYIVTVAAFLIATVFSASAIAQAEEEGEFHLILLSTTKSIAARVGSGMDNRWTVMEVKTLDPITRGGGNARVIKYDVFSVDCANRGVEGIRTQFNIELDPDKEPHWANGPINPKYEKGFDPSLIKHLPVAEFLAKQHEYLTTDTDEKTKKLLNKIKAEPHFPEQLIAAVAFACLVVEKGIARPIASVQIMADAGLLDVKTLNCSLAAQSQDKSTTPMNLTIRFSETNRFVQVQRFWVQRHAITPEEISLTWGKLEIEVNRFSGRATATTEDIQFDGACKVADRTRHQF